MKKVFIGIITLSLLAGCNNPPNINNPATEELSSQALKKTKGLEDCNLYSFTMYENNLPIYIVRCPKVGTDNLNYMVQQGKSTVLQTVITINGVEYIQKE